MRCFHDWHERPTPCAVIRQEGQLRCVFFPSSPTICFTLNFLGIKSGYINPFKLHTDAPPRTDRTGFRGNLHYVSSRNDNPRRRQQVINTVEREIAVRSTPDHIQLVLFCDASVDHKDLPALPGGYAVVFNEHCPGQFHHERKVVMGWHMPHIIDNMIGEAIAIAQAIQVAGKRLRAAHLASRYTRAATVKVFTDGNQVLEHIDGRAAIKGFRQETYPKAIRLVCEQSHELGCIPGLDVKLDLFWVPGHAGVVDNDTADKAAKQILRNPRH